MKNKILKNSKAVMFGTVIVLTVLLALWGISFGAVPKAANASISESDSSIVFDGEDSAPVDIEIIKCSKPIATIMNGRGIHFSGGEHYGRSMSISIYSILEARKLLYQESRDYNGFGEILYFSEYLRSILPAMENEYFNGQFMSTDFERQRFTFEYYNIGGGNLLDSDKGSFSFDDLEYDLSMTGSDLTITNNAHASSSSYVLTLSRYNTDWNGTTDRFGYSFNDNNYPSGEVLEDKILGSNIAKGKSATHNIVEYAIKYGAGFYVLESRLAYSPTAEMFTPYTSYIIFRIAQLGAPVVTLEDNQILKWNAVSDAKGYRIFYNDKYIDTKNTSMYIAEIGLDVGNYSLKVRAIGNTTMPQAVTFETALRTTSVVMNQFVAVNYNVNGDITTELAQVGSIIKQPAVSLEGYYFGGWYYDKDFTQEVKTNDTVTSNITLYAKFTENEPIVLTFWQKVGNFFKSYWWTFALGAVILIVGGIVAAKKKRG